MGGAGRGQLGLGLDLARPHLFILFFCRCAVTSHDSSGGHRQVQKSQSQSTLPA